jgi:hypothetical protein
MPAAEYDAAPTQLARDARSKHPHPNIVQVIGAWEARDGKLVVVMGARHCVGIDSAPLRQPDARGAQSSWRTACA